MAHASDPMAAWRKTLIESGMRHGGSGRAFGLSHAGEAARGRDSTQRSRPSGHGSVVVVVGGTVVVVVRTTVVVVVGTVGGVVVAVGPAVGGGVNGDEGDGAEAGPEVVLAVVSRLKGLVLIASGCGAGVGVVWGPKVLRGDLSMLVIVVGVVVDVLAGMGGVGVKIGATAMSGSPPPPSMVKGNTASTTTAMPAPTRATTRSRSWVSARSSSVVPPSGWPLDELAVMSRGPMSNVVSQWSSSSALSSWAASPASPPWSLSATPTRGETATPPTVASSGDRSLAPASGVATSGDSRAGSHRSASGGRSMLIRDSAARSIIDRTPATPRHRGMKPANIRKEKASKVNAATALARLVAASACPRSRMTGSLLR